MFRSFQLEQGKVFQGKTGSRLRFRYKGFVNRLQRISEGAVSTQDPVGRSQLSKVCQVSKCQVSKWCFQRCSQLKFKKKPLVVTAVLFQLHCCCFLPCPCKHSSQFPCRNLGTTALGGFNNLNNILSTLSVLSRTKKLLWSYSVISNFPSKISVDVWFHGLVKPTTIPGCGRDCPGIQK